MTTCSQGKANMALHRVWLLVALLIKGCYSQQASKSASVCGQAPMNSRIVGGEDAPPGAWPWQVSVHLNGFGHFCGGSLINSEWVLSAAHCFPSDKAPMENLTIFLGRQSQELSNPNEVNRTVVQLIPHPQYNSPSAMNNDMALLRLSSPVTFTPYIRPVCLAAQGSTFYNGTMIWVTGWGTVNSGVNLPSPQNLQEVTMPLVGNQQCNCSYGGLTDNMLCAGLQVGGKDSCQGDSGGPLVFKHMVSGTSPRWVQPGVVSFGIGCGLPGFPGVYARVSNYQAWINMHVGSSDPPGYVQVMANGTDPDASFQCPPPPPMSSEVCGQAPMNNKIVGGEDAMPGAWPWQVSIHQAGFGHFCGGSLINNEWVLSAAHCFPSDLVMMENITIFLGRQSQELSNPNEVSRMVLKIIPHPQYNSPSAMNNDMALVKLSSPVTFTKYIRPVCLAAPGSTFYHGTMTWVTGWGTVNSGVPLPSPQNLQEVTVPVVGNQQCNCSYGGLTHNMLCAGLQGGGKDSCQGDSGGPMVVKTPTRWVQPGVVSFGNGCGLPDFPGVYARVSRYQAWINAHVGNSDPPGFVKVMANGVDPDMGFQCPTQPPPMTTHNPVPPGPTEPVRPCESLFCGGPNTVHFSYFTYVLTLALMLYSLAGFA